MPGIRSISYSSFGIGSVIGWVKQTKWPGCFDGDSWSLTVNWKRDAGSIWTFFWFVAIEGILLILQISSNPNGPARTSPSASQRCCRLYPFRSRECRPDHFGALRGASISMVDDGWPSLDTNNFQQLSRWLKLRGPQTVWIPLQLSGRLEPLNWVTWPSTYYLLVKYQVSDVPQNHGYQVHELWFIYLWTRTATFGIFCNLSLP